MTNSYELFEFLYNQNLLKNSPEFWWPDFGSFKVLIGAVLAQNTKWENVLKSFDNLEKLNGFEYSLKFISSLDKDALALKIAPSGFKNQKSNRILLLCKNIINEYEDFNTFKTKVSRDWLLSQKGIGPESADSILCYCCGADEMVVDSYTKRLLKRFGYEFESYDEIKQWLEFGINENYDKIESIYGSGVSLNYVYARFHGKIVEFMKNQKALK